MTTKSNLHTHCTYCDGKDTMADMAHAALLAGLTSLGFSSHYPTLYDFDDVQIPLSQVDSYFTELDALKAEYSGRLEIFKGMELECRVKGETRPVIDPRCDYTIGSLHYVRHNGSYFAIDYKESMIEEAIESFGSARAFIEDYYEEYLPFAREVDFDIIGHIDLYTKLNGRMHYFDPEEPWYKDMVLGYIEALAKTGKIFEVNTGAISRGYTKAPYPAPFILKRLLELKAPITISADAHSTSGITCAFEETEELLRSIGFKEQAQLTRSGFVSVAL